MSSVRRRVASSDWCASRMVVSVSSTRCAASIQAAKPCAPSSSNFCLVPGAGASGAPGGSLAATRCGGRGGPPGAAFAVSRGGAGAVGRRAGAPAGLVVAVNDGGAEVAEDARGAIALARPAEQLRRFVDEARGVLAVREARMRDELIQEAQVGDHAAHAELPQRTVHARDGFLRRG